MSITIDVDKCPKCGSNNVKTVSVCRSCQAPLPWAKPAQVASSGPPSWLVPAVIGLVVLGGVGMAVPHVIGFFSDPTNLGGLGAAGIALVIIGLRVFGRALFRSWLDS